MAVNNQQYDELMRMYDERQTRRNHLVASRRKQVLEAIPEYEDINGQIASVNVALAKCRLLGTPAKEKELKAEHERLCNLRDSLKIDGISVSDYLNPPYECEACQDTGFVGQSRCHCFKQAAINLVYKQSRLDSTINRENFDAFDFGWYRDDFVEGGISSVESAVSAFNICRDFAEDFDVAKGNLLIFGDTGVGKTFLSNSIAKELLDTGHSVIYFSAHELFEVFEKNTFDKKSVDSGDYDNIFNCDLLIIDDLGTEFANSFTKSQFFICLNERIRSGKSILISTNLNLGDIADIYSERVFSRISSEFKLVRIFGDDIRIKKKLSL